MPVNLSIYLSICLHITAELPLHRFSSNLILGTIIKLCWETPNLVKMSQQYWALYMKTYIHLFINSSNKYLVAWQQPTGNPILVFPWKHLSVLYWWQLHVGQQHKENTLLHLHGNNGYVTMPLCYVMCTLPIQLLRHILSVLMTQPSAY